MLPEGTVRAFSIVDRSLYDGEHVYLSARAADASILWKRLLQMSEISIEVCTYLCALYLYAFQIISRRNFHCRQGKILEFSLLV